jgi:hypothetical protein
VSAAFLLTFYISFYVLSPLQQQYFTGPFEYASLVFLPHGVRVLSAWLLGWKAIPIIFLPSIYAHWLIFGESAFSVNLIVGLMSGVICATFSFWILANIGMDLRISNVKVANWKDVFLAGCVASVLNSVATGLAFQHDTVTIAIYLVGDLTGLFVCMLILMFTFKALRKN